MKPAQLQPHSSLPARAEHTSPQKTARIGIGGSSHVHLRKYLHEGKITPYALKYYYFEDKQSKELIQRTISILHELSHPNICQMINIPHPPQHLPLEYCPFSLQELLYNSPVHYDQHPDYEPQAICPMGSLTIPGEPNNPLILRTVQLPENWELYEENEGSLPPNVLSEKTLRGFISGLFDGVIFMHEKSYVHRNLTPQNLLVTDRGVIKITDLDGTQKIGAVCDFCNTSRIYLTPALLGLLARGEKYICHPNDDKWAASQIILECYLRGAHILTKTISQFPLKVTQKWAKDVNHKKIKHELTERLKHWQRNVPGEPTRKRPAWRIDQGIPEDIIELLKAIFIPIAASGIPQNKESAPKKSSAEALPL